jgi:hypothetical protein
VQCVGIIGVIFELRLLVKVSRLRVDVVEGTADVPIPMIVVVKSADIKAVNYPREVGALAKGAIESKSPGAARAWRGVERDKLAIAEPHQEVRDHCLLLNQA